MIITDTNFIKPGAIFPPSSQRWRIIDYETNLRRYDGTYNDNRKLVITLEEGQVILPVRVFSTQVFKLIADKQISLLFNEKPVVSHKDADMTKRLHSKITNTNLWYKTQQVYKSMVVCADGVFNIYKDDLVGGTTNWVNPKIWYKIPQPWSIEEVQCHVFAQELYETGIKSGVYTSKVTHIRFITHYRGEYFDIVFKYTGQKLGKSVDHKISDDYTIPANGHFVKTGLSDFAVFSVHNSLPIDAIYGISDYKAVEDFILEDEKRATMFSMILDQNSRPYKIISIDLVSENELTGKAEVRSDGGTYIKHRDGDSKPIELVSVDIKVEAHNAHMQWLSKGVSTGSEFGEVFLNAEFSNASGEALKTLLKGPLDKVSRHIDSMDFQIKSVLCGMMELDGVKLSPSDIDIAWQDGITDSQKVIAETMKVRIDSGTLSRKSAIQRMDSKSPEQSAEELDIVKQENSEGSVAKA